MKYKEVVYIINDLCKLFSDDTTITEDHIMFLLNKYRGAVLQLYLLIKKYVSEANYLTICLDLEAVEDIPCILSAKLRSVLKIPTLLPIGNPTIYGYDYFGSNFNLISKERFKFAGSSSAMANLIYTAIGPDSHLYFKSCNPQLLYLKKVKFYGVFEDAEAAAKLSCDGEEDTPICDIMEREFPLEAALLPNLMLAVLKDILGASYRPQDNSNNANDDLASLAYFISRNVKSALAKLIDGTD